MERSLMSRYYGKAHRKEAWTRGMMATRAVWGYQKDKYQGSSIPKNHNKLIFVYVQICQKEVRSQYPIAQLTAPSLPGVYTRRQGNDVHQ